MTVFYLYIPEETVGHIISVKIKLSPKDKKLGRYLIKRGPLWRISLPSSELERQNSYSYVVKREKLTMFGARSSKGSLESGKENISEGIIQRDIFSAREIQFKADDMQMGFVAQVKDILLNEPKYETESVLHEFDNLILRNPSHCEGAFEVLFRGNITPKLCLLLLHSIQKEYVNRNVLRKADMASKVWKKLQNLDQETRHFCGQYVQEILRVYDATGPTKCSPLHYINEMQPLLNMSMLHHALTLKPLKQIHRCEKPLLCLRNALEIILNHDDDSEKLMDLISVIIESINEKEVLEAYLILKELDVPERNMELKKSAQELVLANIKDLLRDHVTSLSFSKLDYLISKVGDDIRPVLILHCEREVLAIIRNSFHLLNPDSAWKFLENVSKDEKLFQSTNQQALLLDVVLKLNPCLKRRYFIKDVLRNFRNTDFESAMVVLKSAYDELFATIQGLSSDKDLKLCFEEYDVLSRKMFFQKDKEHFEGRMKKHLSKYLLKQLLKIHADVESLRPGTVDFYCVHLNGQLKDASFSTINGLIQTNWESVNTR